MCITCCPLDFRSVVLTGFTQLSLCVFDFISYSVRSFLFVQTQTRPQPPARQKMRVAGLAWRVRSMTQLSRQISNGDPWPRPASGGHNACETSERRRFAFPFLHDSVSFRKRRVQVTPGLAIGKHWSAMTLYVFHHKLLCGGEWSHKCVCFNNMISYIVRRFFLA